MTTHAPGIISLPIAQKPLTIGEMVVADYRKAEVFRKFGLDYCCGGKKPLEEVCAKKGINPQPIQEALDALDQSPIEPTHDFEQWPLDKLSTHIVEHHHQYVAAALPMLYELTAKVARVHGERHPELVRIAQHFDAVGQELQSHMLKEERVLFPYIQELSQAQRAGRGVEKPAFGSVKNPIQKMESDHESAGGAMETIRQLSHDYTPPEDACTSYRVLFAKLQEFEQDLHQHVHLENNLLFPKTIALENVIQVA